MKECTKCKIPKDDSEFYKSKLYKDGMYYWCKSCWGIFHKRSRAESNRKNWKRYHKDYEEKHPEKLKAGYMLRNAVRDGRIEKPTSCTECGDVDKKIQAHHHSYEEKHWLDVVWLCEPCHKAEHTLLRRVK
jgi:hypothetical protein